MAELQDLAAFVAVARARGFREAARGNTTGASTLSEAVRRLEGQLSIRLFNRTTRSVSLTDAGARLLERLVPALSEIDSALDVVNSLRDTPMGTLRLNVPAVVAKLVLPPIAEAFLHAHPDVRLEVTVEDSLVDVLAAGCDAGVRFDETLEQDMVAVPLGPRIMRYVAAASPGYLRSHKPIRHPRDLLEHSCMRVRFANGRMPPWEFEKDGELVRVDPPGRLVVSTAAADAALSAAVAGLGVVMLFEEWLRPALKTGALKPVLKTWWHGFSGPFLYYSSRRYLPAPLRAFVDFIQNQNRQLRY